MIITKNTSKTAEIRLMDTSSRAVPEATAASLQVFGIIKTRAKKYGALLVLSGALMLPGCTSYPVSGYPGYYGAYPNSFPYPGYHPAPVEPAYQQPVPNNGNHYPGYYPPAYSQPPAYQNNNQGPQSALPMYQQVQIPSINQYGNMTGNTAASSGAALSETLRY